MYEKTVTIQNKLGLHARPASLIVQTISKFKSDVYISKDSNKVNGQSIMSVMMLAAESGSQLTVQANGEDEVDAVNAVVKLVEERFYED